MQNRNMFPYRRPGPKKRNKNNNPRRPRGLQKGLPNSARDLLPVLQPATKALAQVLAGRSNPSGQLAHAQAVLAHAERLIGERAHNRLNPSEREEFFEQLARLRLTLSDAAAEAEVIAAEEQTPRPVAPPVAQERLRALALALSTPAGASAGSAEKAAAPAADEASGSDAGREEASEVEAAPAEEPSPRVAGQVSAANARSGRLQLSRGSDDEALAPQGPQVRRTRSRARPAAKPVDAPPAATNGHTAAEAGAPEAAPGGETQEREASPPAEGNGGEKSRRRPRRRKTAAGVPEGWVIDEEGFVVPGPQ